MSSTRTKIIGAAALALGLCMSIQPVFAQFDYPLTQVNPPPPPTGDVTSPDYQNYLMDQNINAQVNSPAPAAPFDSSPVGSGSSQPLSKINNLSDLAKRIASIADVIIYILVALAVVYIVYAVVQYFIKGKEGDENRKEAGMNILYGIIGLAIIVSIWGIVNILIHTFGTNNNRPAIPSANFISNN